MSEQQEQPQAETIPKQELTRETLENAIKNENNAPQDVAAAFFSMEQPRLKACIDQMSQNQMTRLLYNLVSYPHVKPGQELKSDLEKKAFYIANEMLTNKYIMQLSFELQKAEEAQKLMEQQNSEQNNVTEIKGESNGG